MYFDTLTISAIADELRAQVVGGRVQHVVLPDELSVALEIYAHGQRRYLLASANAQTARVHLTDEKIRRGVDTETPLLLLLRKYVRGGHLVEVVQPPWERILRLRFGHPEGETTLVVETMGRHSNIMLLVPSPIEGLDEGNVVLDAVKRVTPAMSRVRPILPRTPYQPPPPQDKLPPDQLTERRIRDMLDAADPDEPLWRVLLRGILGLSPLSAREVAYRVAGHPRAPVSAVEMISPLPEAIAALFAPVGTGDWQPTWVRENDEIIAFAPYPLTQYESYEPANSISAIVGAYFAQEIGRDTYAQARGSVQALIDEARGKLERQRQSLQRSLVSQEEMSRLRQSGELILAYQWQIGPGQTVLEAPYEIGGEPLHIQLDPARTPVENAQAYFERYDKAKRAGQHVPTRIASTKLRLDYLEQLATDLALAESRPDIDAVHEALVDAGFVPEKRRRRPSGRSQPIRVEIDGFTVWIGRNARQNDDVTFKRGTANDLWLHARGIPGAHVVIKQAGHPAPEPVILAAAQLAAYHSSARNDARVAVDVTEVRHVRRIKGGAPGQVVYSHERTLHVEPRREKRD
jgi:predicted ribosome quality control (RQC) complex YloA/Tae2 family protein